ncbi:hypothetical protein QUF72_22170 [Desulfobacterales bacterium HSG2]|nr:hypothetical protein [Desulfobacterales bacterium HSG2]
MKYITANNEDINLLKDLLREKKEKMDQRLPEWEKQRDEWIDRVKELYEEIHAWLKPLEDDGYLKITYTDISISEEQIGLYSVQKMLITFFNNRKIELEPVGLHVIGSDGRIDMKFASHTMMLIGSVTEGKWMFAERREDGKKGTSWNFDQDSLKSFLKDFIEEF